MSTNDGRRTPIAWPTLGIVGVTGAVGRVVLDVLPMRDPHWGRIRLAAGEEDVGSVCRVNGEDVVVEALEPAFFDGIDVAIFDIPPEIAQEWVEMAASRGVVAIDNSTAFRTRDDVPLVVPEVNSHKAVDRPRGIIANPGATVMTMIDALAVLHAVWELTGLVVTTLQAASGRGRAGMSRLYDEIEVVHGDRTLGTRPGDVRRGQSLVVVEGNESMRSYPVTAPFDGIVLARNTNIGDVAGDNTLIEMADLAEVWVELHAIGKDAARLAPGQRVQIESATGDAQAETVIQTLLPLATRGQSIVARASLPNPEGHWRPGMTVSANVTVSEKEVPLAVKETGFQRFRDFTVVFAQVGDSYEVRMLELGVRDGESVEVLDGLKPGTRYVTEQSYLIKADIEKSGASHDH